METRWCNLVALGISRAHLTHAGQQKLDTGKMLLHSVYAEEDAPHTESCSDAVQRSTKITQRKEISQIQDSQSIFQNSEVGDHMKCYLMLCNHK